MKFLNAFTFITLAASSVYGSAIDTSVLENNALEANTLEARATTCVAADVQAVKDRVKHYNVFCQMYNAQSRSSSFLPTLGAKKLTAACACILKSYNGKANPTSAPAASATTCVAADKNLITNEYPRNSNSFCQWWDLVTRTRSPIPGVGAAEVTKACKCYNAAKASTATTAVKVTSTKASSSNKATTTATSVAACKKRRRVRRTVTVAAAEATPTVLGA